MNIDNSEDWDVDRSVGAKFGGEYSDVDAKVWIGDGKVLELEALDEFGSGYVRSVNKFINSVRVGVSLGGGDSIGWGFDIGVG